MNAMICEMCGSNDLIKQDGVFICQCCGTKYSVEEARKMLGTVKIDKTEDTRKILILARRARDNNDFKNAEKYYGMILQEDPNDWEAAFFYAYYQSVQCNLLDIGNAVGELQKNVEITLKLISEIQNEEEKKKALHTVVLYLKNTASGFADSIMSFFKKRNEPAAVYRRNCSTYIVAIYFIYVDLETSLKRYKACLDNESEELLDVQKTENAFINSRKYGQFIKARYRIREAKRISSEIKAKEPSYVAPRYHGCYVATAIYGSYDCPPVWTLRRFRDNTLAETWYGRAFIRVYYAVSPTLIRWFGQTTWFKKLWKRVLDCMVERLNSKGVDNTPYDDQAW